MSASFRLSFLLLAAFVAAGSALAADGAPHERQAKQAVDDRADTRIRSDDVGKGTHYARKPLGTGAYFNDGSREAVRRYYAAHPPKAGARPQWEVGNTLPAGPAGAVPAPLLGKLPKVPPGHRYVQLGGDVLLVASGSRMVVDGIKAPAH